MIGLGSCTSSAVSVDVRGFNFHGVSFTVDCLFFLPFGRLLARQRALNTPPVKGMGDWRWASKDGRVKSAVARLGQNARCCLCFHTVCDRFQEGGF